MNWCDIIGLTVSVIAWGGVVLELIIFEHVTGNFRAFIKNK